MDQLRAGNEVRREHWPIEVWPFPASMYYGHGNQTLSPVFHTKIWHLYSIDDTTICQGFNSGVCGADNDAWGDLGTDSGCWTPTPDDMIALDWQLISDVGPEQIEYLDKHRMTRHPNEAVAEYQRRGQPNPTAVAIWLLMLAAVAVLGALFWATFTGRIPW